MSDSQQSAASQTHATGRGPGTGGGGTRPTRASLLRRLAEAADGVTGTSWFVASYIQIQGKHIIHGPFASETEAAGHVPGADYGVFGPFEGGMVTTQQQIVGWDVHMADGTSHPLSGIYDAFFWTESSLRKFALPYYANVVGPEYAIQIRDEFRDPDVILMAHDPLTEYRMISVTRAGKARVV